VGALTRPAPHARSLVVTNPEGGKGVNALSLAFLVMAIVASFALLPRIFRPFQSPLVGKEAPGFELKAVLNGPQGAEQVSLASLKGKAVILDFWATWCGPCRAEAPLLDRLSQRFQNDGLVVLGVNTNDEDGLAAIYGKKTNLSYPLVYDTQSKVARTYGVDSFPTLVVVDREGKVSAVRVGVTDEAELDRLVKKVL
jgi:cytochrome c biogenesis protein CcmG/thiol:disulfide interchange protein DsbE